MNGTLQDGSLLREAGEADTDARPERKQERGPESVREGGPESEQKIGQKCEHTGESRFSRTELLYGREAVQTLHQKRVCVFGLGGVGGHAAEALARSGVGALDLVDHDRVSLSNLNRQIIATERTLGQDKVDAARERILEINPACRVTVHKLFFLPETAEEIDFSCFDYVADAVDNVTAKLCIAERAQQAGVPVISAMGTGNKLNPSLLRVADLYDTKVCPLARVLRKECRKRGISGVKAVYSEEEPLIPEPAEPTEGFIQTQGTQETADGRQTQETRETVGSRKMQETPGAAEDRQSAEKPKGKGAWQRVTPGSNAIVPATAGLLMASVILDELTKSR